MYFFVFLCVYPQINIQQHKYHLNNEKTPLCRFRLGIFSDQQQKKYHLNNEKTCFLLE